VDTGAGSLISLGEQGLVKSMEAQHEAGGFGHKLGHVLGRSPYSLENAYKNREGYGALLTALFLFFLLFLLFLLLASHILSLQKLEKHIGLSFKYLSRLRP
jgi:hypothetical protein